MDPKLFFKFQYFTKTRYGIWTNGHRTRRILIHWCGAKPHN